MQRAVPAQVAQYIETEPLRSAKIRGFYRDMRDVARPVKSTDQPLRSQAGSIVGIALIVISIVAGGIYPLLDGRFGPGGAVMVKGAAIGALALAAVLGNPRPRYWLAAIMAAGALGDMLLEIPGGFGWGAGAFAIGHVIAIGFYWRRQRDGLWLLDVVYAAGLIGFGLITPYLLLPAIDAVGAPTLYAVLLCTMAAAAWISGFPRRWTALGALLFVVSDTLLLMRMGGLFIGSEATHGLLLWFAYYLGQLGIFIGITIGLNCGIAAAGTSAMRRA